MLNKKGRKGDFLVPWEVMLSKCINKKKKIRRNNSKNFPKGNSVNVC